MRSIIFGIGQANRGAIDQFDVPVFPQPTLEDIRVQAPAGFLNQSPDQTLRSSLARRTIPAGLKA